MITPSLKLVVDMALRDVPKEERASIFRGALKALGGCEWFFVVPGKDDEEPLTATLNINLRALLGVGLEALAADMGIDLDFVSYTPPGDLH